MIELKHKRSLTAKHLNKGDGGIVFEGHLGHIHYDNKLGFGDGEKGLRGIDYTLLWDDKKRGWYFNYGSFNPFIPEYADDWATFRDLFEDKDQEVKYKPVCEHIKGRLIKAVDLSKENLDRETTFDSVIYDDAYGKGFDLIYTLSNSGLKKLIRLRKGFKAKDYDFKFEVAFPDKDIYRALRKEDVKTLSNTSYKLDKTAKTFDSDKQILVGTPSEKEWATYLRTFKVWTKGKEEVIKVDLTIEKDKTFLTKHITKEFLQDIDGDVFTDTTTSYYAGSGDGWVYCTNASWSTCRGGSTGTASTTETLIGAYIGVGGSLSLYRCFLPIDTSGLGSGATISAATLKLNVQGKWATAQSSNSFCLVQTSQASTSSLTSEDYDQCGALNTPDEGCTRQTVADIASSGYEDFDLNATGLGWISKTGFTKLGFRNSKDVDNSEPTTGDYGVYFYPSEQTGTASDPYLSVTYTAGSSGPAHIASINGVAIANIASKNGVAIANILSINGVD